MKSGREMRKKGSWSSATNKCCVRQIRSFKGQMDVVEKSIW